MRRQTLFWIGFGVISSAVALSVMLERHFERLPRLEQARAVQWVFTAAWLEEQHALVHGTFAPCGGPARHCGEVLSWMTYARRMHGWDFRVELVDDGYEAIAQSSRGAWRLKRGDVPRFEETVR